MITEGSDGRILEVTKDHELVWEYISPYRGFYLPVNQVYRAYRYPYDYVPQIEKPEEVAIERIDVNNFRMPGAKGPEAQKTTSVNGTKGYHQTDGFCVKTEG